MRALCYLARKVQKRLRFAVYLACRGFCAQARERDDNAEFSLKIPRATLIEEETVARFRNEKVQEPVVFARCVRRCLASFGPCSKVMRFTGRKGCSTRSTAVIVSLFFVLARSEAVYDMHFVPLRGYRKGHRLRPAGRSVSGTWMHLQYEHYYGLGMNGLVMGRTLWNVNVITIWVWLFW